MTNFLYKQITNGRQMGGRRDKGNIRFIVIHYTGNDSRGANAMAHYRYLQNATRYGSAHYYVDDENIIQCIGDSIVAWAVGDNQGYGTALNGCTNYNSISIEMCINSDGDFNKTYFNTVELTKELLRIYPNARVCRHYDVSRKECPMMMKGYNNSKWNKFLSDIKQPRKMILDLSKDSVAVEVNSQKTSTPARKGWVQENSKWYYYIDNKKKIGWLKSGKAWFYMQPEKDGEMKTGWLKYNNNWFYFNEKGYMLTGEQVIDGKSYKFNSEGYLL